MKSEQFTEFLLWWQFLCFLRHHLVKLTCLHEVYSDVDASYELPTQENLRKSGPLGVEL